MANPNFPSDGQAERIDALVNAGATVFLKYGVGSVTVTGATNAAAWHGVATHVDGATAGGSDGVVLLAGESGTTVKHVLVDSSGRLIFVGSAADGAAPVGNPVLIAGQDGTNQQSVLTDTTGRVIIGGSDTNNVPTVVKGGYTNGASSYLADRTGNVFKTATATASGNTAVWTPTTGKKFRLLKFNISISDDSAITSGANLVVKFQDATTDIGWAVNVYLPASIASPDGMAYTGPWVDIGPGGFLSAAANNVLNINLSSALTAGQVRVNAMGTEE